MSSPSKRARKPPKKLDDEMPLKSSLSPSSNAAIPTMAAGTPGVTVKAKKSVSIQPPVSNSNPGDQSDVIMAYLHNLSGQNKLQLTHILDHNYCRPWNRHPDPNMKCRPAKYLFMKDFPRHKKPNMRPNSANNEIIDVLSFEEEAEDVIVNEAKQLLASTNYNQPQPLNNSAFHEKPQPQKHNWTPTMHKLWNRSLSILSADRLSRLTFENRPNFAILERSIAEKTSSKFRHLFSSIAFWDSYLLNWLRATLTDHVCGAYLNTYHESMQLLRMKVPSLVDKFYPQHMKKIVKPCPVSIVLGNCRPKRIQGSPLFIIIPNGPTNLTQYISARQKNWNSFFGSLGKVINVNVPPRPNMRSYDCLKDIRSAVRDQIKDCKRKFSDHRQIFLVGFGESSLIGAHCSLELSSSSSNSSAENSRDSSPSLISGLICLGFPITSINGFRGDLDDPLLEINVPTLFVIGQNSTKCALDDIEDFRERILKTETGLVVVGGCNDRLLLSDSKKKYFDGINQAIIDRCLADEIHEFVTSINNNKNSSSPNSPTTPTTSAPLAAKVH